MVSDSDTDNDYTPAPKRRPPRIITIREKKKHPVGRPKKVVSTSMSVPKLVDYSSSSDQESECSNQTVNTSFEKTTKDEKLHIMYFRG